MSRRPFRIALMAGVLSFCPASFLSAHRLDELLQAAQVSIDTTGVTIVLYQTPGVEVAEEFLARIDTNKDDVITPDEEVAYGRRIFGETTLALGDAPLAMSYVRSAHPPLASMRGGEGTVRLEARATITSLAGGRHRLTFTNSFDPGRSVYQANAMLPKDPAVSIFEQDRDGLQKTLRIDFGVTTAALPWLRWGVVALLVTAGALVLYFATPRKRTD